MKIGSRISQIGSWRVANEATASGDQPMSASRKPKTSAMPPMQSSKPSLPHVRNTPVVSCCILLKFHEFSIMFYQPSPTIINHHQLSKVGKDYHRLSIIGYLKQITFLETNSERTFSKRLPQSVEWIHGSNRISRSSTSTDRRSGRWWWVTSMCSCGILWTWINVCWIYYN